MEQSLEHFKMDWPMIYEKAEHLVQDGLYDLVIFSKDGCIYTYSTLDRYLVRISRTHTPTEEEYAKALGQKLYWVAFHKGFDQRRLAEALGVSQGTISNYMTGRNPPSLYQIHKMAMIFNVPMTDLVLKF